MSNPIDERTTTRSQQRAIFARSKGPKPFGVRSVRSLGINGVSTSGGVKILDIRKKSRERIEKALSRPGSAARKKIAQELRKMRLSNKRSTTTKI